MIPSLETVRSRAERGNVIPLVRDFLPDVETPITALHKLRKPGARTFLLESVEIGEKLARYSFLGRDPLYVFRARGPRIEIRGRTDRIFAGDALGEFRTFLARFRGVEDPALPAFAGGAVGFFAYDAIRLMEKIPEAGRDDYGLYDLDFGVYEAFVVFDHLQHRLRLVANVMPDEWGGVEPAYARAVSLLDALERDLGAPLPAGSSVSADGGSTELEWKANVSRDRYLEGVRQCKEYILAGDAFQIVLSQRFEAKVEADGISIYRHLRAINPSPYMYYLDYGDFEVVGASPEMLVKSFAGVVETKPVAGTRRRGRDEAEDAALAKELMGDPKEIAEHIMLVDLGRNDLGRVCAYGSVHVPEFMQVEKLSHVMHIVSLVRGKLKAGAHALDALMSCLPAGTLSGAPKIRAMQIIDGLEPTRRGLYGGSVCYLDFRGNLDSCIAIRTLLLKDGVAYVQAGAGIVADSQPEPEYEECKHKARAAMLAVEAAEALEREGVILFIDNYDSFTYNLVQYLGEMNPDLRVVRNDQLTVPEILGLKPSHIVVSPGPCTPAEAGVSIPIIQAVPASIPLLGVCLGHQAIGAAFGGKVIRAPAPMHGKIGTMQNNQRELFAGLPASFTATRYHSLIVERSSLPPVLEITATCGDLIMGLRHKERPIFGLQFHPESILTEHGKAMLRNFLNLKGA